MKLSTASNYDITLGTFYHRICVPHTRGSAGAFQHYALYRYVRHTYRRIPKVSDVKVSFNSNYRYKLLHYIPQGNKQWGKISRLLFGKRRASGIHSTEVTFKIEITLLSSQKIVRRTDTDYRPTLIKLIRNSQLFGRPECESIFILFDLHLVKTCDLVTCRTT